MLEDVENIIITDEEPIFLIVSEDNVWKNEINNIIFDISKKITKL
jgi:hypothetical protein